MYRAARMYDYPLLICPVHCGDICRRPGRYPDDDGAGWGGQHDFIHKLSPAVCAAPVEWIAPTLSWRRLAFPAMR